MNGRLTYTLRKLLPYNNERAFQHTNFHHSFFTQFYPLLLESFLSPFTMASPNTSRTRRVLGDININISTSAFDIDHALSIAKIPKVSESGRPLRNSPDLSKWVGNSTSEVQQENREKDKKLQVGSIEGEVEEEISSKGSEKESKDARISTAVCSSNAGLAQLAGRKRGLSASGDVPEFSETHIRPGSGKKQKTEIQQSLVNAPSTDNFPPCNDMIQGEQEWRETCSRAQEHAPGCDYASIVCIDSWHS